MFARNKENVQSNLNIPSTPMTQPGAAKRSDMHESPVASQLQKKREMRDLNTRLEMYLSNQRKNANEVARLKDALARNEVDYRQKVKQSETQYNVSLEKYREQNESLQFESTRLRDQMGTLQQSQSENDERMRKHEAAFVEKCRELEMAQNRSKDLTKDLELARGQYYEMKHKFDSDESVRNKMEQNATHWRGKHEELLKAHTNLQSRHTTDEERYRRMVGQKTEECESLKQIKIALESEKEDLTVRLRSEFDGKLKSFVDKREEQYKAEKEEWMRIFKEEFNRKLRMTKESNYDLMHSNKKLEEQIEELHTRLAQVKKVKTELEVNRRNLEEDLEKNRHDLDEMRRSRDEQLRSKTAQIARLNEEIKRKDIDFKELQGLKVALDNEIESYRTILMTAEKEAGYSSPLAQKRRRTNNGESVGFTVHTPGIARGALMARADISKLDSGAKKSSDNTNNNSNCSSSSSNSAVVNESSGSSASRPSVRYSRRKRSIREMESEYRAEEADNSGVDDEEMDDDDEEEQEASKMFEDRKEEESDLYLQCDDDSQTPGGESFPLQFSTMDLNESTLEIQNVSESEVNLEGYTVTNKDRSCSFQLPKGRILQSGDNVRLVIGADSRKKHFDDIIWPKNVWTGTEMDIARLYNPAGHEIARIEISPEMLDHAFQKEKGCIVM